MANVNNMATTQYVIMYSIVHPQSCATHTARMIGTYGGYWYAMIPIYIRIRAPIVDIAKIEIEKTTTSSTTVSRMYRIGLSS